MLLQSALAITGSLLFFARTYIVVPTYQATTELSWAADTSINSASSGQMALVNRTAVVSDLILFLNFVPICRVGLGLMAGILVTVVLTS